VKVQVLAAAAAVILGAPAVIWPHKACCAAPPIVESPSAPGPSAEPPMLPLEPPDFPALAPEPNR
jgi:hypothetical protein